MNKWLLYIEKSKTLFYNGKQNTQNRRFFFSETGDSDTETHDHDHDIDKGHPSILIKLYLR